VSARGIKIAFPQKANVMTPETAQFLVRIIAQASQNAVDAHNKISALESTLEKADPELFKAYKANLAKVANNPPISLNDMAFQPAPKISPRVNLGLALSRQGQFSSYLCEVNNHHISLSKNAQDAGLLREGNRTLAAYLQNLRAA
jgi:hypothetical protein